MEEEIFIQEKKKLKEIVEKIKEEEKELEDSLSNSDKSYDLENIAKANSLQFKIKKLEDITKL